MQKLSKELREISEINDVDRLINDIEMEKTLQKVQNLV